jgi:hypothetical protein
MTIESHHMPQRQGTPAPHASDGSLSVTAPTGTQIVLNPTAAALWELLDGATTVDELVQAATSLFSGSPDEIRRDIVAALDELGRQELLV